MTEAAIGTPHWMAMGPERRTGGLLFIHGAGGNAASWHAQVTAFSAERRCVAYDLRGFGRSPAAHPSDFPAAFAADARAVMDAAGLDSATVVCQSLGGWSGLRLALEAPDRVEQLVLCCTMAGVAHPPAIEAVIRSVGEQGDRGPAALALPEAFRSANPIKSYLYAQITAFSPTLDPALAGVLLSPDCLLPLADLARVEVPVLVLAGELDGIWPPETLRGIAEAFPSGSFEIIQGCGHSIYFEQPETFDRLLNGFLSK